MCLSRCRYLYLLPILLLFLGGCSPADTTSLSTNTPEPPAPDSGDLSLTGVQLIWPATNSWDNCESVPPPLTVEICASNQGEEESTPESINLALPALMAKNAFQQVLGSLPGGEWLPPYPISLIGLPGILSNAEGIIIINNTPGPDSPAAGIIIINNFPSEADVNAVFIVIQNMPDPLTAHGIIIAHGKEAGAELIGSLTLEFEILEKLDPGQTQEAAKLDLGFGQVAADITQDHYQVTGKPAEFQEFSPAEVLQQMDDGVVWGGLIPLTDDDTAADSSLIKEIEFIIEDNLPSPDGAHASMIWGSMPENAVGIIIVNNLPSPETDSEGIIIVNNHDISQVMGIIMEDKPGEDQATEGIIVVDNIPGASSTQGVAWDALVWGSNPGSGQGSEGITIINNKPALGINNLMTGMPFGFEFPEGMTPMMGEGVFGPGPMAFGAINLQTLGQNFTIPPGEDKCMEAQLSGWVPLPAGFNNYLATFNSFFQTYSSKPPGLVSVGDVIIISALSQLGEDICGTFPVVSSEVYTATPSPAGQAPQSTPTPTLRTGLPTKTLISRLPTPTPTPSRGG